MSIFCYWLQQVNKQLGEFFDLVKEKSYLKKTVTAILSLLYILVTNSTNMRFLYAANSEITYKYVYSSYYSSLVFE